MSQENGLSPEEQAMEAALSQLRPIGVGFDAATVQLEARLRRMSRQVWMWRAAAVLALAAGVAGVMVQRRLGRWATEIRPTVVSSGPGLPVVTGPDVPALPMPKDNYLAMRDRVLSVGLSALEEGMAKRGPERPEPKRVVPTWNPFKQEQL